VVKKLYTRYIHLWVLFLKVQAFMLQIIVHHPVKTRVSPPTKKNHQPQVKTHPHRVALLRKNPKQALRRHPATVNHQNRMNDLHFEPGLSRVLFLIEIWYHPFRTNYRFSTKTIYKSGRICYK